MILWWALELPTYLIHTSFSFVKNPVSPGTQSGASWQSHGFGPPYPCCEELPDWPEDYLILFASDWFRNGPTLTKEPSGEVLGCGCGLLGIICLLLRGFSFSFWHYHVWTYYSHLTSCITLKLPLKTENQRDGNNLGPRGVIELLKPTLSLDYIMRW